ncbi:hypothetical protein ACWDA3_53445 [Nonomuraea rubra]
MSSAERRLCITMGFVGYGTLTSSEQARSEQLLHQLFQTAIQPLGFPDEITSWGDGLVALLPSHMTGGRVIPDFISAVRWLIYTLSEQRPDANRLRLRVTFSSRSASPRYEMVKGRGPRLLDNPSLQQAFREHPRSRVAVIVSEEVFRDLLSPDFPNVSVSDFWRVDALQPKAGPASHAWLWVDRPERSIEASKSITDTQKVQLKRLLDARIAHHIEETLQGAEYAVASHGGSTEQPPPDLLVIGGDEATPQAAQDVAAALENLFQRLGPPPDHLRSGAVPAIHGSGGTTA